MKLQKYRNKSLAHFCVYNPARVIFLTVLIALICALLALNIEKNTTPYFLDKHHHERIKEDNLANSFLRTKETIVIVLTSNKLGDSLFKPSTLGILEALHKELGELDLIDSLLVNNQLINEHKHSNLEKDFGLKQSLIKQYNTSLKSSKTKEEKILLKQVLGQYLYPIKSVKSLFNTDDIFLENDDIVVAPNFTQEKFQLENSLSKQQILSNPMLVGSLVSRSFDTISIHVELEIDPDDSEAISEIFHKIKKTTETAIKNSNITALYSGSPVVNVAISEIMERDNQRYFPLIILLISFSLFFLFKSIWAPILALSVAVLSILITFGIMSLLGITLNIVTTILPIFIITIGVTDAIHILSKQEFSTKEDQQLAIEKVVNRLFKAMLLTSLTTSLGFFSLSFTEITNIRDFGIMVGISALIAFIISVTTLPAFLAKLGRLTKRSKTNTHESHTSNNTLHFHLFTVTLNQAKNLSTKAYYLILGAIILFSLGGLPNFYVDQQNLESFKKQTQIRQDNEIINNNLGGTVPITIWIKSQKERGILDPQVLSTIEQLQAEAANNSIIGYSVSIVDFLSHINSVLIPENKNVQSSYLDSALISQLLFLLEGGPSRDLESVSNVGNYTEARIVLMSKTDSSEEIQKLLDNLDVIATALPNHASYMFAGYGNMNAVAAKEIVYGQLSSIVISIIGLLVIISLIYKSIAIGLISLFPLTMSLLAMFGLMGYAGIPLDIGSSLLCGVAFGIGIDYSIHIIESYKRMLTESKNAKAAIDKALSDVSHPILTSALTISLGFSILMLSDFKPIFNLGLLISVTMLVSALCALFIIPRLLLRTFKTHLN